MFRAGSEMAGNLMLLAAMALHARYVLLDAEGLLPHPEPQDRPRSRTKRRQDDEVKVISLPATDGERSTRRTPLRSRRISGRQRLRPLRPWPSLPPTSTSSPSPVNRKLTKAERKALKERLLRERQEREGRE